MFEHAKALIKRHREFLKKSGGMEEKKEAIAKKNEVADRIMARMNLLTIDRRVSVVPVEFERRRA